MNWSRNRPRSEAILAIMLAAWQMAVYVLDKLGRTQKETPPPLLATGLIRGRV